MSFQLQTEKKTALVEDFASRSINNPYHAQALFQLNPLACPRCWSEIVYKDDARCICHNCWFLYTRKDLAS